MLTLPIGIVRAKVTETHPQRFEHSELVDKSELWTKTTTDSWRQNSILL